MDIAVLVLDVVFAYNQSVSCKAVFQVGTVGSMLRVDGKRMATEIASHCQWPNNLMGLGGEEVAKKDGIESAVL